MRAPIWGFHIRYVENAFGAIPTSYAAGGGNLRSLRAANASMLVKCEELTRQGCRIIWARVDDAGLLEHW